MNLLFQTRKPRGYHHVPIYFDEQKERIEEARKDLAKRSAADGKHEGGSVFMTTTRRRKPSGGRAMIMATIVLLTILFLLMTL